MKRSTMFGLLAAISMFTLCLLAPPTWHPVPTAPGVDVTDAYQDREGRTTSVLRATPTGFHAVNKTNYNHGLYNFATATTSGNLGSRSRA